jgi:hypothetical protein
MTKIKQLKTKKGFLDVLKKENLPSKMSFFLLLYFK